MSKFVIEISDAPFMKTFLLRYAGETLEIAAADLPELVSAAQAALAEQNSGVVGPCEICNGSGFEGARTMQDGSYEDVPCRRCWSRPQAQRREECPR